VAHADDHAAICVQESQFAVWPAQPSLSREEKAAQKIEALIAEYRATRVAFRSCTNGALADKLIDSQWELENKMGKWIGQREKRKILQKVMLQNSRLRNLCRETILSFARSGMIEDFDRAIRLG
jgi:hypothetical protein